MNPIQPGGQRLTVAAPEATMALTQRMALAAPTATAPVAASAHLSPEEKAASDWLVQEVLDNPKEPSYELQLALNQHLKNAGLTLPEHQKRNIVTDAINTLNQGGAQLDQRASIYVLRGKYLNEKFDPLGQELFDYINQYPHASSAELRSALDSMIAQAGFTKTSYADKKKILSETISLQPDIGKYKGVNGLMGTFMAEDMAYTAFSQQMINPDENTPEGRWKEQVEQSLKAW